MPRKENGLMILDLQKDQVLLSKLYEEYNKRLIVYKEIDNYYEGKTKAQRNYGKQESMSRSNRKASVNYLKKFTKEEISFCCGNKTTYISKENNNQEIKDIEYYLNNQYQDLDLSLCEELIKYGSVGELAYLYDGEIKFKTLSCIQSICYTNEENMVELGMYFYTNMLDDNIYCDVYDDVAIYTFKNQNFLSPIKVQEHYFGMCPISYCKFQNGVKDTLYSDIHELCDMYEETLADNLNNLGDLRSSYLVLTGVDLDEETAKNMKSMGILQTSDTNGDAKWLCRNVEAEFSKNLMDKLEDLIYQQSQHINHNVVLASNTSGIALSSRLISLRNKCTIIQQTLKNALKTRIRLLFSYLNILKNNEYDVKDIEIKMTMNLPADDVSTANVISQLRQAGLSVKTGLSQLSFVTDSSREFEEYLNEQKQIEENSLADLDKVVDVDE